jgi:hypothetical protein
MYRVDKEGVEETRQMVQFMSGLMNEIHDVTDEQFSEMVSQLERRMTRLLPNADMATVAWTMYAMGFVEAASNPMRGLFYAAMGDALISREETRESFGEEFAPRPTEEELAADEAEVCGNCQEQHPEVSLSLELDGFKELMPQLREAAAQAKEARRKMQEMHQEGMREALEGDPRAVLRMLGLPEELIDNAGIEVEVVDTRDLPPNASKADFLRHIADREAAREEQVLDKKVQEVTGGDVDFDTFLREVSGGPERDTEDGTESGESTPEG